MLRAIAVLCVFFAHLCLIALEFGYLPVPTHVEIWKILLTQLGRVGVLFFFVHTALVLMLSLDRTQPVGLIVNFYIRRIFRVYPLCIVCILAVLVLKVPQVPDLTYVPWNGGDIFANLLLIQNVVGKDNIIMPLWTLPREVQLYLALPFIYLVVKRFSSVVTVLIVWFAFFAAVPFSPQLSCFPCFMGGVLAYQIAKEKVFKLPSPLWPAAIFGLSGLYLVLVLTVVPDYRADYIVCMLLGLIIPNVVDLNESWVTRASRSVAKYSYGIYLFHDPVIWFAFIKLKSFPVPAKWACLALLMILVPLAAHRWLEAPLIDAGHRLANRWSAACRTSFAQWRTPRLVDSSPT
jgi:peptidoglycan/LPS O-acetylase OafA/YrhL